MSQGPTQDHQPWYQRACGGVSQRHSGTPLLCLQSLGGAPQQQPLGMATSVKGLGELVPGWPALAHPCPLASVHSPTQTPLLAFSLPQVTPSPAQPPGASVLPLGPLKLPPSGWSVSEQALLLCPGAIQGQLLGQLCGQEALPRAPPQLNMTPDPVQGTQHLPAGSRPCGLLPPPLVRLTRAQRASQTRAGHRHTRHGPAGRVTHRDAGVCIHRYTCTRTHTRARQTPTRSHMHTCASLCRPSACSASRSPPVMYVTAPLTSLLFLSIQM